MDELKPSANSDTSKENSSSPVTFAASSSKTTEASTSSGLENGKPEALGFLKFRIRFTKRILPILLIGLVVALLTLVGVATYLYIKESAVKIKDVRISNISDGSATVSWVSDRESKGVVYYGETDSWTPIFAFMGKNREDDDRDVEFNKDGDEILLDGGRKEYFTHHVTIEDLEPNTRYFFRIGTGVIKGFASDVDGNKFSAIETAPVIESLATPNPAYGRVFKFDGSAVADGIVFYRVVKDGSNLSSTLSTTVSNGTWSVDLSNARDLTLSERMLFDEGQTHVLEFDTADGSASVDISKLQYQPANDVILNTDQGNGSYEDGPVKERFVDKSTLGLQTTLISNVYACETKDYRECCGPARSRLVHQLCDGSGNNYWTTESCVGDGNCPGDSGGGGGEAVSCDDGYQYQNGGCVWVAPGPEPGGGGGGGSSGGGSGSGNGGTGGGTGGSGTVMADSASDPNLNCLIAQNTCLNGYCGSSYTPKWNQCSGNLGNCQCLTGGTGGGGVSGPGENGGDISCVPGSVQCSACGQCFDSATFAACGGTCDGACNNTNQCAGKTGNANVNVVASGQCILRDHCCSGGPGSGCYCDSKFGSSYLGDSASCQQGTGTCQCTSSGTSGGGGGGGGGVTTTQTGNQGCSGNGLYCTGEPVDGGTHCFTTTDGNVSVYQYCCPKGKVSVSGKCIPEADAAVAEAGVDVEELPQCSTGSCPGNREGTALCNMGGIPQFCCKAGTSYDPNQQKCTSEEAQSDYEYCKTNCCSDIGLCNSVGVRCEDNKCVDRTAGDLCSNNVGPCYSYQLQAIEACTTVEGKKVWCCPAGLEDKNGDGICENPESDDSDNETEDSCGDGICQAPKENKNNCPSDCTSAVQGASDEAYSLTVNESGSYSLLSSAVTLTNQEVQVFVPTNGSGSIKFFADLNKNGVKDEGEDYIKEDLGINLELTESEKVYEMNKGWNLIGLNSFPTGSTGRTAKALLENLNRQGAFVTHIATYRDGSFLIFSQRNGKDFGNDFNIIPGEAYFIRAYTDVSIRLRGNKFLDPVPVRLNNGWNLMSIIKPNTTLTAEIVLDSMISQGINSDALSRYQSGLYTSVIKQNGELFGRDFNIVQTDGYFVRVKDGGGKSWTP